MNAITRTREIILRAPNLGTEEDPLSVEIERGMITIQTDPGDINKERQPASVTITFEQFEKVAAEYGHYTKLVQQKDAAE